MALSVSITEDDFMTALRDFLVLIVSPDVEVIQAQDNRVPQPLSADHIIMTPKGRLRLSTNSNLWDFSDPAPTALQISHSTQIDIQLDIHGPRGGDIAQLIATLMRDQFAFDNIDGGTILPLYATDGHQAPFETGEKQYENRWTMDVVLQSRPVVSTPQQFMDTVGVTIVPVPLGGS